METSQLNVSYINARSVRNKTLSISDHIIQHDVDVFPITETWLHNESDQNVINELVPAGHKFLHKPRLTGRGGGVGLVYKSTLTVKEIDVSVDKKIDQFEYIVCELSDSRRKFIICVIYRATNKLTLKKLWKQWAGFLSGLNKHKEILPVGDLNFHL